MNLIFKLNAGYEIKVDIDAKTGELEEANLNFTNWNGRRIIFFFHLIFKINI